MNAHTIRVPATKKISFVPAHKILRAPGGPPSTEAVHDRIRARAYELYEARTANGGAVDPESDWLQAEQELINARPELYGPGDIEIKSQLRGDQLLADDE